MSRSARLPAWPSVSSGCLRPTIAFFHSEGACDTICFRVAANSCLRACNLGGIIVSLFTLSQSPRLSPYLQGGSPANQKKEAKVKLFGIPGHDGSRGQVGAGRAPELVDGFRAAKGVLQHLVG